MPILIPHFYLADYQMINFLPIYETVRFRTVSDTKADDLGGVNGSLLNNDYGLESLSPLCLLCVLCG